MKINWRGIEYAKVLVGNPNDILEDYMIYKVIRNVYVTDCLNDIIRKVEIIHEALDLRELVSVVADMVRQVACESCRQLKS